LRPWRAAWRAFCASLIRIRVSGETGRAFRALVASRLAVASGDIFLPEAATLIFARVASECGALFRPVNVVLIFALVASRLVLPLKETLMLARCCAVRIWPVVLAIRFATVSREILRPVSFALIRALLSGDMGRAFLALVATRFAITVGEIFRPVIVALRFAITSVAIFRPIAASLIRARVSAVTILPLLA